MSEAVAENLEPLKPPFSRSAETEALGKEFVSLDAGKKISYSDVHRIIHTDPQTDHGRGITASARSLVMREHNIVIECIRNEGFLRATDPEKIQIATGQIDKVRRAVRRGVKVVRAVDKTKVSQEESGQCTVLVAVYGALSQATKPKILKEVERALDASSDVRAGDVLQLVLGKGKRR